MGLLLYTLVAGRGPFSHIHDPIDAIEASLHEQPAPPSRYAAQEIPAALDDAIMMAIEKSPENRFQSAEAFSAALASIAGALSESTQPIPARFEWRTAAPDPSPAEPRGSESTEGVEQEGCRDRNPHPWPVTKEALWTGWEGAIRPLETLVFSGRGSDILFDTQP